MAEADRDMNKLQWTSQINLGNIITLAVMLVGGAIAWGSMTNKIDNLEAYRVERVRQTDARFAEMGALLKDLPNLNYRITSQEEALKATNARVDASLSNISERLAEINQALGGLSTQVAVLTQRLENGDGRRASVMGAAR